MAPDTICRLVALSNQLIETLMTAALCGEEIRDTVRMAQGTNRYADGLLERPPGSPVQAAQMQRPLLDESTLSVTWNGRTVHLGNTVTFRLMERLARQPNQYVTHIDLLSDVWDNDDIELSTIRSAVHRLRRKLRDGGISVLAKAIRGHNGRYILDRC